ncbi:hypothetical protein HLV35_03090 [Eggerthellaceae bacterium zg-997]|nr:hypothetical protein [Eggerthellaceae bacterium zg-997]
MRAPTVTLLVRQRQAGARDRLGNEVVSHGEPRAVSGCLLAPGTPAELSAERPEGARVTATAHFPKGHGLSLRGALVSRGRGPWLRVVGEPMGYPPGAVRGPWDTLALLERVDG